jgi:leucine dehydrogenase
MDAVQQLIAEWNGEFVVTAFDADTGSWIFVAIHDTTLGPALGGLRMRAYPTQADAVRDAMRLAEGMTHKWAALGLPRGGGKSVVAVSRPLTGDARRDVLHRYGRIVASLRGTYACGPDLGSTPEDMRTINDETEHAHGWDRARNQPLDPGPFTALGVFLGMRAALRQVFGSDAFAGRSVLIQGIGDVGLPLARQLREARATLAIADIDEDRARRLAGELGATVVAPDAVHAQPCDVFAPCAVGATLNATTIPQLACRIVAGSANNQLAEAADGDRLHARGILYAPDYVVNGGGAAALPALSAGAAESEVLERVRAIEGRLDTIFAEARSRAESPAVTARRMVERILADGRAGKQKGAR